MDAVRIVDSLSEGEERRKNKPSLVEPAGV